MILQLLFFVCSSILHIALGIRVEKWIKRFFSRSEFRGPAPVYYALGLLLYLLSVLVLKCLKIPWGIAAIAPLLFCLYPFQEVKKAVTLLRPTLSINFALWLAVNAYIASTIIRVGDNISTPWLNNYGDVAFHVGMITSFVFGENFPPEYHLFPGQSLSYPFLINLWTACIWWIKPTFSNLQTVFAMQWMATWTVVFIALQDKKNPLISWALLFGGSSFAATIATLGLEASGVGGNLSSLLINQGFPWTAFLPAIWITQRSTLLGLIAVLPAISLFHSYLKNSDPPSFLDPRVFVSGLLFGLSLLAHTHFFLVGVLYLGLLLLFKLLATRDPHWFRVGLLFSVGLLPALCVAPLLADKSSIITFTVGWMSGASSDNGFGIALLSSAAMWLRNAPIWLCLLCGVGIYTKQRAAFAALLVLFVAANIVQLAVWEFDQIKVFIALYAITLLSLPKTSFFFQLALALLVIPGLIDFAKVTLQQPSYEVYSADKVKRAAKIREAIPKQAIIIASPDHNSLVTLTGRKLFLGYDGTLHSHGLPFQSRQKLHRNLEGAISCSINTSVENSDEQNICPDYLVWTDAEQRYWERDTPPLDLLEPTLGEYFYKLLGSR